MNLEEIKMPEFLLAEQPIKDDSLNANRMVIYCTQFLSLIEVWPFDLGVAVLHEHQRQKQFQYKEEEYVFVIVQNNVENFSSEIDRLKGVDHEEQLLDRAWAWYCDYTKWEDAQNF